MIIDYYYSNLNQFPKILETEPDKCLILEKKGYHKCWAYQFSTMNRFYFRSLFDFEFTIIPSKEENILLNNDKSLHSNSYLDSKKSDQVYEDKPVVQIKPGIVFSCKENCYIETQQSFYSPGKVINGKFDISKWERPVHPSLELEYHKKYKIKRGDILCEIVFYTKKINENIKLNLIKNPEEKRIINSSVNTLITSLIKKTKNIINGGR